VKDKIYYKYHTIIQKVHSELFGQYAPKMPLKWDCISPFNESLRAQLLIRKIKWKFRPGDKLHSALV
jgi:hypothetical protein